MPDNANPLDFNFIMASSVHDIKNSLSMLLHSLDEVSQEVNELQLPVADRMATLQYEAARVNNDLVQLLSLYKMENEALRPHIDEHFLNDFLEEHVARYHPLFKVKDMRCDVECDDSLSGYFDRDLISGVINNTLANAIRYSHDAICVSAFRESGGLTIMVEDDGGGFPVNMLEQPGNMTEGVDFESGSTHLGLYFAYRIATLHTQNGQTGYIELSNDSRLGGGTFKLHLP
ncbi:sensor histidine kinase [Hahella ganghwensis]|uniref:sensor histidine kinase n=1 Tax=Hahella ganghwensis TaxID=286420 RepID=UPI0003786315|nr:HAMP domain-containing sensor histidine kinase [Hahella ganghwensis]